MKSRISAAHLFLVIALGILVVLGVPPGRASAQIPPPPPTPTATITYGDAGQHLDDYLKPNPGASDVNIHGTIVSSDLAAIVKGSGLSSCRAAIVQVLQETWGWELIPGALGPLSPPISHERDAVQFVDRTKAPQVTELDIVQSTKDRSGQTFDFDLKIQRTLGRPPTKCSPLQDGTRQPDPTVELQTWVNVACPPAIVRIIGKAKYECLPQNANNFSPIHPKPPFFERVHFP
jgi:hypothetical protein